MRWVGSAAVPSQKVLDPRDTCRGGLSMSRVDGNSPTGRLDAYIRSFEERYGSVPIEGLNDSLASISSISLEASAVTKEPNGGPSRPVAPRSMFGFTPRFQWEEPFPPRSCVSVEPVEPVTHVSRLASPTRHSGPDLSQISVPRHKLSATALSDASGPTGTTAATGYLLSASDTFDLRLRSPTPGSGAHWGGSKAFYSQFHHTRPAFGSQSPSKRPERARASSNPPELKMKGPRSAVPPTIRSSFGTIRPMGSDTYFSAPGPVRMSFIHPLPAPRGPRPPVPQPLVPPWGTGARGEVDAVDEVNCQSPVRIPPPTKLLNSSILPSQSISQISSSEIDPSLPSGRRFVDVRTAPGPEGMGMMGVCETGVQTDGQEASFASPMRFVAPHSPDNSLKPVTTSTPDFGEVKMELEIMEKTVHKASPLSSDDFHHLQGELPEVSGSKLNADVEGLKERLQNALARSLSHLMNLQALTVH